MNIPFLDSSMNVLLRWTFSMMFNSTVLYAEKRVYRQGSVYTPCELFSLHGFFDDELCIRSKVMLSER